MKYRFSAVPKSKLQPGDLILVPTSPGFALVTVEHVRRLEVSLGGERWAVDIVGGPRGCDTHLGDSSHFEDAWRLESWQ